jgi:putative heme-binding domain-containing protein
VWPKRSGQAVQSGIESQLAGLISSEDQKVARAAANMVVKLGLKTDDSVFAQWVADAAKPAASRVSALRLLALRKYSKLTDSLDKALSSQEPALRGEAVRVLSETDAPRALTLIEQVLNEGTLVEKQSAVRTLGTIKSPGAQAQLSDWMDRLLAGTVVPEVQLDLLEAVESAKVDSLTAKAENYESSLPKTDPLAHFLPALSGGDAERGKMVFMTHAEAACVRCHSVGEVVSTVGPNLAGIGAKPDKPRRYILESMILPNAFIVPGYGVEGITLKNGSELSGMVKSEDGKSVHLVDLEGKATTINKSDIATRTPPASMMPAMGAILSRSEIRDVIEYVESLK